MVRVGDGAELRWGMRGAIYRWTAAYLLVVALVYSSLKYETFIT